MLYTKYVVYKDLVNISLVPQEQGLAELGVKSRNRLSLVGKEDGRGLKKSSMS